MRPVARAALRSVPSMLLACTTLALAAGRASAAPTVRWLPQRRAFGNCSWPSRASCPSEQRQHGGGGNVLDQLLGMYASWNGCAPHATPRAARHHQLVEVARIVHPLSRWKEGFTTGWLPNRSGHAKRIPYGCWYYLSPGSGVWLNVSRTRVARTREELRAEWRLHHRGSDNNDAHFCAAAIAHGYNSIQFLTRANALSAAAHDATAANRTAAARNGSGSVAHALSLTHGAAQPHERRENHNLFAAAQRDGSLPFAVPELAYCAGPCVSEESRTACPGVPLQRSGGDPCTCDAGWPLLRCKEDVDAGRHMRVDPCPAHGVSHGPATRSAGAEGAGVLGRSSVDLHVAVDY